MISRFIKQNFARWTLCSYGAVAVEFALIFPVLAMMLIAIVDLGMGVLNYQKVVNATQVASNIFSRGENLHKKDVDDVAAAVQVTTRPFSERTDVNLFVGSYLFDEGTPPSATAQWCQQVGDWTIPASEIQSRLDDAAPQSAGTGIIIVGVEMEYQPIFAGTFLGNVSMQWILVTRSRTGNPIQCPSCSGACPV